MIGRKILHYRIIEELGRGGMGVVYKAEDENLKRFVALKFLPSRISVNEEERTRFRIEAQSAASLNHPNITTIYSIEEIGDEIFIVMEYIEGRELKDLLKKKQGLPLEDILNCFGQLAAGLQIAHDRGVIHRDIKSSNIMITDTGQAKIMDFGLAKRSGADEITKSGAILGTVAYMSPEQASAKGVDYRTDIWAMGVVLYEMLTGELPFKGEYEMAIVYAIMNEDPERLSALRPELPNNLQVIIDRALAKGSKDRYSSIIELSDDLAKTRLKKSINRSSFSGILCPKCHQKNLTDAVFCSNCGAHVADKRQLQANKSEKSKSDKDESSGRYESEKRQATIVVSHLSSYEDLVEQVDPHELDEFLEQIQKLTSEIVERHEGVLQQFTSDEIIMLFGVPVAHEDDYLRAVRAARELHKRVEKIAEDISHSIDRDICLRSGIHTGSVVTQLLEDSKYKISGNPLLLAKRLAEHSDDNETLVSPKTQRLISPFYETKPLEPISVRGEKRPIVPCRILKESGYRSRLEAAKLTGLTPYVGRQKELQTLHNCLNSMLSGEGQLVSVVGEAGVGKSRLQYEFCQILDRSEVRVVEGRCQSFGSNIPYLPFQGALRTCLNVPESHDSPDELLQIALDAIREISTELEEFIPLYLHLLSIRSEEFPLPSHLEGEEFRRLMVNALAAIFTLAAQKKPLVLLLEDWHWVDDASADVLSQMVEMVSAYSLLIKLTARPEAKLKFNSSNNHTQLHLSSLGVDSSLEIMKSVLEINDVPDELARRIHERTAGNPFFLEEICLALKEEGTIEIDDEAIVWSEDLQELQLPNSVQAVIRTRLDRLDSLALETLRHASIIGREFDYTSLEFMLKAKADTSVKQSLRAQSLNQSLEELKAMGMIQQVRILPDALFRFRHILTQEVTYESMLKRRRKTLHEAAGEALEELHPNRVEENRDLLVHHFSSAEAYCKALHYALELSQEKLDLGLHSEAHLILEKSKEWLSKLPDAQTQQDTLVDLLFQMERVQEAFGARNEQQPLIDQLMAILEPAGPSTQLAKAYLRQGDLYTLIYQYDKAQEAFRESLRLSRALSDPVGERDALRSQGLSYALQAKPQKAVIKMKEALAIDRRLNDSKGILIDLISLSSAVKNEGHDCSSAIALAQEGIELCKKTRDRSMQSYLLHTITTMHISEGNIDQALETAKETDELYKLKHTTIPPHTRCWIKASMAHIALQRGKIEESLHIYQEAIEISRSCEHAESLARGLQMYGEVLVALHRHKTALPVLEEAAKLFSRLSDGLGEATMMRGIARACEKLGHYQVAIDAWKRVEKLQNHLSNDIGELEAREGVARMSRSQGADFSKVSGHYISALELATKLNDRDRMGKLLNTIAILHWQHGDYQVALQHYERALVIFGNLKDTFNQGLMLNSIGVTLRKLGQDDKAEEYLTKAIEHNHKFKHSLLGGHGLAAQGDYYFDASDFEKATDCYERSLKIRRTIADEKGEGWMLYNLARVHFAMDNGVEAGDYLKKARKIAKRIGDDKLQDICNELQN